GRRAARVGRGAPPPGDRHLSADGARRPRPSPPITSAAGCAGAVVALLLAAGVSARVTATISVVVRAQSLGGFATWRLLADSLRRDAAADIGMSLALGTGLAMLGHVILRATPIASIGWLLPSIMAGAAWILRRHALADVAAHGNDIVAEIRSTGTARTVIVGTVLLLGQWPWALPLLVPAGLSVARLKDQRRSTRLLIGVIWCLAFAAAAWLRSRNLDWWIRSWDVPYYESKSWSIAYFGPGDNMSLAGRPMNYHWFGLAWLGSLSMIAGLPQWVAITQAGPVVVAITCSALLIAIARQFDAGRRVELITLSSFGLGAGAFSLANPPNYTSIMWLLAGWLAADRWLAARPRRGFLPVALSCALASGAKVSNGFAIIAAVVAADVGFAFRRDRDRRTVMTGAIARAAVLGAIGGAIYFAVLGGTDRLNTHNLGIGWRTLGYLFQVDEGRHPLVFVLGSLGALLGLVPTAGAVALGATSGVARRSMVLPVVGAVAAYMPLFVLQGEGVWYFGTTANVLLVAAAGLTIGGSSMLNGAAATTLSMVLLGGWLAGEMRARLMEVNWRDVAPMTGGPTAIRVAVLVGAIAMCVGFAALIVRRDRAVSFRLVVAAVLLASITAPVAVQRLWSVESAWARSALVPAPAADLELREVSKWLAAHADRRDVLAINRFCLEDPGTCIDAKWFPTSATTRMRVLVEGPFYTIGDDPPAWALERRWRSTEFVDRPTEEGARWLFGQGVRWIIVSRAYTARDVWEPWAPVVFETESYALLHLREVGN
ncbi:MAG: hypothetical protein ACKOD2_04675, partial [Ilumatobacteraceae bacterium]